MTTATLQKHVYAQVALEVAVDKLFSYRIRSDLVESIKPGVWVRIPFGRTVQSGCIIEIIQIPMVEEVKDIFSIDESRLAMSPQLLTLAKWMAEYYFCPLGLVLRVMVPATVRKKKAKTKYSTRIEVFRMNHEKVSKKAKEIIDFLKNKDQSIVYEELKQNFSVSLSYLRGLAQKGYLKLISVETYREPQYEFLEKDLKTIVLTQEQERVQKQINQKIQSSNFSVNLLHGITGSGKTEVYLNAIQLCLRLGKQAIFLVPEIALTPQTSERVKKRFAHQVVLLHSRLSHGERFDAWQRIVRGQAHVVVGPRSAIFAPFKNLGLIIIDEEHERTYKQEELPRYHARDVAIMRAKMENATVILGSATPSLESYFNAEKGKYDLIQLTKRVENRPLPEVKVIDMRKEGDPSAKFLSFSYTLKTAIANRLLKKEQIILFLNRRGYAPLVMCPKCGKPVSCEQCDMALTYHRMGNILLCHLCNEKTPMSKSCPRCSHPALKQLGVGTQRIESLVQKIFPQQSIVRMDTDSTTGKDSHYKILKDFREGKTQILIGTQMISKGLDFPNVTLVGVVSADIAMSLPDFRMGEHIFQQLTQVAGRSGRGHKAGEVYIQTFTPMHPVIQAAARHDYAGFYASEIKYREELGYPPFCFFIAILFKSKELVDAKRLAYSLVSRLKEQNDPLIKIMGPHPAPLERIQGVYRWQLIIQSKQRKHLHQTLRKSLAKLELKRNVKMTVDVDPISMV